MYVLKVCACFERRQIKCAFAAITSDLSILNEKKLDQLNTYWCYIIRFVVVQSRNHM